MALQDLDDEDELLTAVAVAVPEDMVTEGTDVAEGEDDVDGFPELV